MRNQKGYVAGYNGQAVVTAEQVVAGAMCPRTPSTAPCSTRCPVNAGTSWRLPGSARSWASAGSPTALKRVRALLQQLDRARVHRLGSGGREFRP
jgi:hypothetical protein